MEFMACGNQLKTLATVSGVSSSTIFAAISAVGPPSLKIVHVSTATQKQSYLGYDDEESARTDFATKDDERYEQWRLNFLN